MLEEASVSNLGTSLGKLLDLEKLSNDMFWVALTVSVLFFAMDKYVTFRVNQKGLDKKFVDVMWKYTDPVYTQSNKDSPGFSWGTSKTLIACKNMIDGWKPESILVDSYESRKFQMRKDDQDAYEAFCQTPQMAKAIRDGNNMQRYMVSGFRENYSMKDSKLLFSLRSTEWSQTCFWWNKMRDRGLLAKEIGEVSKYKSVECPNSFCLHLVLTTKDDQVVMARISANKSNDYPETYAATIGEQVEKEDFMDSDFRGDFVTAWVRRAMKEEFGFSDSRWGHFVNSENIRVLALEMEGDIYNIALIVNVQLNMDYAVFRGEFGYSCVEKEISKIEPLAFREIPRILVDIENNRPQYHPSTYLRLLMVYLHKYGQAKTYSDILKAEKAKQHKTINPF